MKDLVEEKKKTKKENVEYICARKRRYEGNEGSRRKTYIYFSGNKLGK